MIKTKQLRRPFTLLACLATMLAFGFAAADTERDLLLNVSAEKMDAIIISERIFELEELYRPTSSIDLRPKKP